MSRLDAAPGPFTLTFVTENKRITHSSPNGNQEQTARRCQEPELEEEKRQNESQTFTPSFPLTFTFIAETLCSHQSIHINGEASVSVFVVVSK